MRFLSALLFSFFSVAAYAGVDCSTNCDSWASFNYPCPNLKNPRKVCKGTEPTSYAVCSAAKVASCEVWQNAVRFLSEKVKPMLEHDFNSNVWAEATSDGERAEYFVKCEAAFVAATAALGAQVSGPWGAAISGGIGAFVGFQICEQSTKW